MEKPIFLVVVGLGDTELSVLLLTDYIKANNLGEVKFLPVAPHKNLRFRDRVKAVYRPLKACTRAGRDVYLVGNSAGTLACLIAASKLGWWHWWRLNKRLQGVIALSPATPRWNNPLGWPLMKRIWKPKYSLKMLSGQLLNLSEKDYEHIALNSGILPGVRDELVEARLLISGKEARKLAGLSWTLGPRLGKVRTNVLIVSGEKDNWVKPKAHKRLFTKLHDYSDYVVAMYQFSGLAHILIPSERGEEVVRSIISWIDKPTSGMKTRQ